MTTPYTRGDSFSCGVSREHIERALVDHGATDVCFSHRGDKSAIAFRSGGRQFRIVISLPHLDAETLPLRKDAADGPGGDAKAKIIERANRRVWHATALAVAAKLGAVAAGAATLESEFLAHVVLPGNRTVLDEIEPVIASAYQSGLRPAFGNPASSLPAADQEFSTTFPHRHILAG